MTVLWSCKSTHARLGKLEIADVKLSMMSFDSRAGRASWRDVRRERRPMVESTLLMALRSMGDCSWRELMDVEWWSRACERLKASYFVRCVGVVMDSRDRPLEGVDV